MNLLGVTKFTARKYFDLLLTLNSSLNKDHLIPIIVTCLRTAVKVLCFLIQQCESQFFSAKYTLEYAKAQCGGTYPTELFVRYELKILSTLNMRTKLVTPYCFLSIVRDLFPESEMTMPELTSMINFLIIEPCTWAKSAEVLFFASLLYYFRVKKSSPICFEILKALTNNWE